MTKARPAARALAESPLTPSVDVALYLSVAMYNMTVAMYIMTVVVLSSSVSISTFSGGVSARFCLQCGAGTARACSGPRGWRTVTGSDRRCLGTRAGAPGPAPRIDGGLPAA